MSYFSKTITVPKNTTALKPYITQLEIQFGIIHRVYASIPSGHAGLTGVRITKSLHQIAPTSGSEWFSGDDMKIDYNEHVEIFETPFELTIEAYNTDDTYSHTFVVGVGVLPEWVLLPQQAMQETLKALSDLFAVMSKWLGIGQGG
jgi:hypothetical protein